MKKTFNVVDMFCGAGGESTGIMQAALQQNMNVHLTAINHWERAIETHAANHPGAEHLCESVEHIDPTKAIPGQRLDLLWASPECTHHSNARGGRPRSDQSRASAWMILKWLSELYVERVIIENVPEFLSWGPLGKDGHPIQKEKGKIFNAFISSLQSLGYSVDWKILTAADYGDPTTRRRLFVQAVKGRKQIVWPEITHMDGTENLIGCQSWRPAREIIDWTIPGTSIFDRKRPLADATMRRIAAGIEKYWKDYAKPFLAVLYGSNDVRSLDMPFPAVTCSGAHHALVEPFLVTVNHTGGDNRSRSLNVPMPTILAGGNSHALIEPFITRYQGDHIGGMDSEKRNHGIDRPLPTVDTSNRYALVQPFLMNIGQSSVKDRSRSINAPISTIVAKNEHCLISPFLVEYYGAGTAETVDMPLKTVTTKEHFALVTGAANAQYKLDIRFRMLKPHELAKAQGFPDDYKILGNNAEQTKQIGNAVPVNTAKALVMAALGTQGGD